MAKKLVGFLKKSFTKSGITAFVSGKNSAKKAINFSSFVNDSNEFSPSKGINKVQVNELSKLANPINMKFPLGQMCNE